MTVGNLRIKRVAPEQQSLHRVDREISRAIDKNRPDTLAFCEGGRKLLILDRKVFPMTESKLT
jgi:hypothetical protein